MNKHFEEERMSPTFLKHHLRGFPFNAVLHEFTGLDPHDMVPHDHPFDFVTTILHGSYIEDRYIIYSAINNDFAVDRFHRRTGDSFLVRATDIHRIVEFPDGPCFTIIQPRRATRKPGFYDFNHPSEIQHRYWDEPEFKRYTWQVHP